MNDDKFRFIQQSNSPARPTDLCPLRSRVVDEIIAKVIQKEMREGLQAEIDRIHKIIVVNQNRIGIPRVFIKK